MCVRTLPGHYIYVLLFLYFFTQQPKTYNSIESLRQGNSHQMLNKYFLIRIMNKTLLLDMRVVANVIFIINIYYNISRIYIHLQFSLNYN